MATLTEVFTNIANAIRNKTGRTSTMTPAEMVTEINTLVKPTSTNGDYTLINNSSTAFIEFCGNSLNPGSSVVTPSSAYSTVILNGIHFSFSPRLSIVVPNGSTLSNEISINCNGMTQKISSSLFYNMATTDIGKHYVLADPLTMYLTLFPSNGAVLTITAN